MDKGTSWEDLLSSGLSSAERRRFKRTKKSFMARVRFVASSTENSGWDMVMLRDLGAGGMTFSYDRKIPAGTLLDFRLHLPFAPEPIQGIGRVVRSSGESFCQIAASFSRLSEEKQRQIERSTADE